MKKLFRFVSLFIFIIALLVVLITPNVNAITYQQGNVIDIKHPVRVDGAIASGVLCNISVYYPNNDILIDFEQMTDEGDYFNYTLNTTQTTLKGIYPYCVSCFSSAGNTTECFDFNINYGGVEPSSERTEAVKYAIIFVFLLAIVFVIAGLFNRNFPVKITFFLIASLGLLICVDLIFVALQDEIVNPKVENFFSFFTAISFYLFYGIAFFVGTMWVITVIVTSISKKKQKLEM